MSAFAYDYTPTRSSLIGALDRQGISVLQISQNTEADLRARFSSWLSRDISDRYPRAGFKRLLCFETPRWTPLAPQKSPPERVGDILRAILPFALQEPPIRSLAMPVLAAGLQGYHPIQMLEAILDAAQHWLATGLPIEVLKLVVYEPTHVEQSTEAFRRFARKAKPRVHTAPSSQPPVQGNSSTSS